MRDLILALVNIENAPVDKKEELTTAARHLIAAKYPDLIKEPLPLGEGDKKFTVWWRDGTRTVIHGTAIDDAFTRAGYGAGALPAVDWYDHGDVDTHTWLPETRSWVRKVPAFIAG